MRFLLVSLLLVLVLVAGVGAWLLKYSSSKDVSNFPQDHHGGVVVNGGVETADYAELQSIGIIAAYYLKKDGIKGAVPQQEVAEIVLKYHPKFLLSGATFRIDEDGVLVDNENGRKYQVYSDGTRVVVNCSEYSKPQYFPY